ncbi:hypothetical protein CBS101457_002958 [Exobasidium rhododendri]|nr:hypothetical protein CBS101457_002958 [Exobasidium rhododendri]
MDIDLSGTFYLTKALVTHWRGQKPRQLRDDSDLGLQPVRQRGSLVNIASVNGMYASVYMGGYVAAKHGVNGISKTFCLENVEHCIRINTISPGCVYTPIMLAEGFDFANVQQYLAQQAIKRFAHPDEIASACYFLCSDEASFVTGTNMYLDAGWSAH